jgi:hypothetical protein
MAQGRCAKGFPNRRTHGAQVVRRSASLTKATSRASPELSSSLTKRIFHARAFNVELAEAER